MNKLVLSNNCIIIAVGVPAAGKTTILEAIEKKEPSVKVINYGKAMLNTLSKAEIDRDQMRKLSPKEQAVIGQKAAEDIINQANKLKDAIIIVDTHALIQSPFGFVPGLPLPVLQVLQPNAICVVEADPKEILLRRNKDDARSRDISTEYEISQHQKLNRQFVTSCSVVTGCLLHFLDNSEKSSRARDSFLELIRQLKQ